ncbi:TetR/AcrR family transcriptional regulator [Curtobacterium sp. MCPF17_011]|uniref:TetR/AcrR family transcriptional regulator n=1 Tax=Curtobacterium sp. MCPF17_011 TaxID=2175652 RepID=UPI000DA84F50|nr:TetR/AcrR family transcriptional regulator [Curtobacterium sp. MCPF17_011]PZF15525.1 TetR/AcrR family transcriptional regulator [Curtobacterium sp. MCPF17_011]
MLQNKGTIREQLLQAALAIAVADGVEAVSTRAVCAAVGVQAPTLYHHYGDRAGLISAVVDRAFDEYFAQKDAGALDESEPAAAIAAGWDAHVEFARSHPGLYPAMYPVVGPQSPNLERSAALLRGSFDRLQRDGVLADGISARLADAALRAALRGVAHMVAAVPEDPDNQKVSATVRDAVIARLIDNGPKEGTTHD